MVNLTVVTWVRFGIWMAVGVVIYLGYGRRNSVLARRDADVEAVCNWVVTRLTRMVMLCV